MAKGRNHCKSNALGGCIRNCTAEMSEDPRRVHAGVLRPFCELSHEMPWPIVARTSGDEKAPEAGAPSLSPAGVDGIAPSNSVCNQGLFC